MLSNGFVQLVKGEEFLELIKRSPLAFALLSIIAHRARRTDSKINKLKVGEAMIGDYKNYGMTKQNYRTAKKILQNCNLVTLKVTNKGTIAKLIDTSIYDININENNTLPNTRLTHDQHTANTRLTPNNKDNKEKNDKNDKKKILLGLFEKFWLEYPKKAGKENAKKIGRAHV